MIIAKKLTSAITKPRNPGAVKTSSVIFKLLMWIPLLPIGIAATCIAKKYAISLTDEILKQSLKAISKWK